MLSFISYILFLLGLVVFPYKKLFSYVSRFSKVRVVAAGLIIIFLPFLKGWIIDDEYGGSHLESTGTIPDKVGQAQSSMEIIFLVIGVLMIVFSLYSAKKTNRQ